VFQEGLDILRNKHQGGQFACEKVQDCVLKSEPSAEDVAEFKPGYRTDEAVVINSQGR